MDCVGLSAPPALLRTQSSVKAEGVGTAAGYQADVVSQAEMENAMAAAVGRPTSPVSRRSSGSKSVGAPQVAAVGLPLDGLVCSAGVFEATPVAEWNTPYQGHEGTE